MLGIIRRKGIVKKKKKKRRRKRRKRRRKRLRKDIKAVSSSAIRS